MVAFEQMLVPFLTSMKGDPLLMSLQPNRG